MLFFGHAVILRSIICIDNRPHISDMQRNDTAQYGFMIRHSHALLAMLALTGCASIPPLDAPPAPRDPATLSLGDRLEAGAGSFPADRWWTAMGDPQLDRLMEEATGASPDLAAAQARARQAQAFRAQAKAATMPTLGIEGSAGAIRQSQNQGFPPGLIPGDLRDQGRIGALLDFDLDLWGRKRSALAAATSAAMSAQADVAQARLLLQAAIASTYADLGGLFASRDLAEARLQNARNELALLQSRQARGLENSAVVNEAEGQLARATAELIALDEAIALNRNALAALVGAGPERGQLIQRPQLAAQQGLALPGNLPLNLVGRRPDLVSVRLRAESASARIGVARAAFYPDINLAALVGFQAIGLDNLFKESSLTANAGPALRLPIFDGGAARAGYRAARAEYDEAVSLYNAALIAAVREVADAAASKASLMGQIAAAQNAVDAAERQLTATRQRQAAGLEDLRRTLGVERALIAAKAALLALNTRSHQADIALSAALGGGFAETPEHKPDLNR
jgi:NodT family efflux transporter outer membrane factor (OMF) lipoprotein